MFVLVITELVDQRNGTLTRAYTEGTKNNIKGHWESYVDFCQKYQRDELNATVESLSLYVQYLSNRLESPGAVKNYLAGVKTMFVINNWGTEIFDDYLIKMMLRGIDVVKQHVPRKALPITPLLLMSIGEIWDDSVDNNSTYWALFLIAFYLLARKSNLVPDSVTKFNPLKQLTRGDLEVTDKALMVTLKWSKTNQAGRREIFPLPRNRGSPLCPVRAYRKMVRLFPAEGASPAFLVGRYGRVQTVTYRMFQERIKKAVTEIGLEPQGYSSHSFRRGGATYAFHSGVHPNLIKKLGDWRSDAYLEYIDFPVEDRLKAGKQIKKMINKELARR